MAVSPRLAVIGCGAVATYGYLPSLARLGWRPSVLVDPDLDRAGALARRWKTPRVAPEASAVMGDIEAAVVAAPPRLHAPLALPLLEAGIQVLVEKPLATNSADARRMVDAAAASGACLSVTHQRRFLFVHRWIAAAIAAGDLGDIESVVASDGSSYLARRAVRFPPGRTWNAPSYWDARLPTCGEGVLLDKGPHLLDLLLWWLGPVREAACADDGEGGLEADARLDLLFERGTRAVVELSRTRNLPDTIVVEGTRGRLEVRGTRNEFPALSPDSLRDRRFEVQRGAACLDEGMWGPGGPGELLLADWRAAIREGRPSFTPGASALPVVELLERCRLRRRAQTQPWRGTREEGRSRGASAAPLPLAGKTFLVTGATGFIGGRLVERLAREGARVRAAVRRFRAAPRLARFPPEVVELREFDLAAPDAGPPIGELVAGCAAVFHLALDLESAEANLDGIRRLGAACAEHGVRLVFTSSYTVYGPYPDGPLSESAPGEGDPRYRGTNAAGERELARMGREEGLDFAVLQPTIVYGPFSTYWTEAPAAALERGPLVLPEPGDGICNAVHVEDVVSAIALAAVKEEAAGETFLVSGPEHPTWSEFFSRYADAVGAGHGVRLRPAAEIRKIIAPSPRARLASWARGRPGLRRVLGRAKRAMAGRRRRLSRGLVRATRRRDGSVRPLVRDAGPRGSRPFETLPLPRHLEEYSSRCRVDIGKARRLLGYEPAFDLARGMALTADYLRWARGARFAHRRDRPFGAAREPAPGGNGAPVGPGEPAPGGAGSFVGRALRVLVANALWAAVGLAAVGAAFEIALRARAPFASGAPVPQVFRAGVGFARPPDMEIRATNDLDYWQVSRVNSLGFLDREPPSPERAASSCHFTIIGDSFIEAWEVPVAEKVQVRLEELAAGERPDLDLATSAFGLRDTGQAQQLAFWDAYARPLEPKALALVLASNDLRNNSSLLRGIRHGWDPEHLPQSSARRGPDGVFSLLPPDERWVEFALDPDAAALPARTAPPPPLINHLLVL